jgi:transposase
MAMGKRKSEQAPIWIPTTDLPVSPGHPFYARLNAILDEAGFDRFAEEQCRVFYAPVMGRPSLPPGRYFRLLLLGDFEGLDSERGIAWRAADSLAVRSFAGLGLDAVAPDYSTISCAARAVSGSCGAASTSSAPSPTSMTPAPSGAPTCAGIRTS